MPSAASSTATAASASLTRGVVRVPPMDPPIPDAAPSAPQSHPPDAAPLLESKQATNRNQERAEGAVRTASGCQWADLTLDQGRTRALRPRSSRAKPPPSRGAAL